MNKIVMIFGLVFISSNVFAQEVPVVEEAVVPVVEEVLPPPVPEPILEPVVVPPVVQAPVTQTLEVVPGPVVIHPNETRLYELEKQSAKMRGEVNALLADNILLNNRLTDIEEKFKYKLGSAGLVLSVPVSSDGGGVAFGLNGSIKALSAYYYIGSGGGAALNIEFDAGRATIRPFGLGFMAYHSDNVFSVQEIDRSVDIVLPIGFDVRVWKGLSVSVGVAWFIPNPVAVGEAVDDAESEEDIDAAIDDPSSIDTDVVSDSVNGSINDASDAYTAAFKAPRVELSVKWKF